MVEMGWGNIAEWRQAIGWVTPSVSRDLTSHHEGNSNGDLHANHHNMSGMSSDSKLGVFDQVEQSAREFGIDAGKIEIVPAPNNKTAWVVKKSIVHGQLRWMKLRSMLCQCQWLGMQSLKIFRSWQNLSVGELMLTWGFCLACLIN